MKNDLPKSINILGFLAFLLFPIVLFFLIVSFHSSLLIGPALQVIVASLFGMICGYILIYGYLTKWFKKAFKNAILIALIVASFIGSLTFGLMLYGPIATFRSWLIITAMDTMEHNYLCKWFYSDKEIAKAYGDNYIIELDDDVDQSLVDTAKRALANKVLADLKTTIDTKTNGILVNRDEYAIISVTVNNQKGYVILCYDPSKVKVGHTNKSVGQYVTAQAERYGALLAVNGGGFHDPGGHSSGGTPLGLTMADGEVISRDKSSSRKGGGGFVGLTYDNKLVLSRNITASEAKAQGFRDGVTWGPFLVVNGKSLYVKGNGGYGTSARTAMGQREDGTIIFAVVDSNYNRTRGATMKHLADLMMDFGAVNAANLDGGTSSVVVAPAEIARQANTKASYDNSKSSYMIINEPVDSSFTRKTRPIADCWLLMP